MQAEVSMLSLTYPEILALLLQCLPENTSANNSPEPYAGFLDTTEIVIAR